MATRRFRGMAAVFGEENREGVVVERGAFRKTVRRRPRVPVVWGHDPRTVIGLAKLEPTREGLAVEGELNLDTKRGREAVHHIRFGSADGLSVGYNVPDGGQEIDRRTGARRLTELEVKEVSVTPFPAWEAARAEIGSSAGVDRAASSEPDVTDRLDAVVADIRAWSPDEAETAVDGEKWDELFGEMQEFARTLRAS